MAPSPVSISPALSIDDLNEVVTESSLVGKNVLITGGASGVGADLATAFAERGVQFAKANVNSWEEQVEAFKAAVKFHPDRRLDIVIACAGIFGEPFFRPDQSFISSLSQDPEPPTMNEYAVNAVGIHYTARLALEYFELEPVSPAAEPKCLILIGSMVAYTDIPMVSAYTASKYAARGLFRSARSIFSQRGHRINHLAPWLLATPMTTEWMSMFEECGMPIGEVSLARQAVMRLAQDSSINGRSIVIGPRRNIDLCDDVEGNFGGTVAKRYLEEELPGWEQTEKKLLKFMGVS